MLNELKLYKTIAQLNVAKRSPKKRQLASRRSCPITKRTQRLKDHLLGIL